MIEAFKLLGEISLKGGEAVQSQLETIGERANNAGKGFNAFGLAMKGTAIAVGAVVTGAVTLGTAIATSGFKYNSMIENSTVAWTTLLGSQEKAKQQIQEIVAFAAKTQFGTPEVDNMAKSFFNAGITGKALMEQLTRIADVSGAFNITADNAQELARQMAQVDQSGLAYTSDLDILQNQGIPIFKSLAQVTGTNVAQVRKMASQGKITADLYNKAFNAVADTVKGSADKQSQTMTGLLSTLGDQVGMFTGTLTAGLFKTAEGLVNSLNTIISNMNAGFQKSGLKGLFEAILPKATADSIVNAINTIHGAFTAFFDVMKGNNIGAINILTAIGLQPKQVVAVFSAFNSIKTFVTTVLAGIFNNFTTYGLMLSNSGFMNFIKTLWSKYVLPIMGMVWQTISSILSQISAFWQANGATIMVAVTNFWNFVSTIFKIFAPVILFVIKTVWDMIAGVIKGAISIIEGVILVFTAIFSGNWKLLWQGLWDIVKGAVEMIWNFINLMFLVSGIGELKAFAMKGVDLLKTMWKDILTGAKDMVDNVIKAIVDWANKMSHEWNIMKQYGESLWSTIKNTVLNIVDDLKAGAISKFESLTSGAVAKFNSFKSTVSTIFNGIKSFMQNPIQTARNFISSQVDSIMSKFKGMHFDIPHIKLPHFSVAGKFSLDPPSMPHFNVSWGAQGGILDRATLIGAGEAGKEALLPLENKAFQPVAQYMAEYLRNQEAYENRNNARQTQIPLIVNGRELARAIIVDIDQELQRRATIRQRGV